jgi:O-antigen/teichoic acid export membrane protein
MLVVAPVVLRNLGTASYGAWTIATAAANIGAIVASGFGDAIIQQVATRRANGVRDQLFRIVRSAIAIHLVLGLVVSAVLWLLAPYLAGRLALADPGFQSICLSSTRIAAILVFIRAIETVCISVQRGFERYGSAVRVTVAARLFSLLAAVMLASGSYSVTSIMATTTGIAFLGLAIQIMLLRRLLDIDSFRPTFDPASTRELFDFGKFTWILAITSVVFSQSDRIIGGAAVGASAVVAYALCAQIAQPVYGLTAAGLHFLFPYIAFQRATGTPAALRRIVLGSLLVNVLLVAAGVALLLVFSGPLLRLLATDAVARACAPLLPGVVASSGILALTVSGSYAMLALGHVRSLTIINVAAGFAMFLVTLQLLSREGVWALVDARLAFALVAALIYIPLLRSLGFGRLNSRSSSMESRLAGGEGA